MKAQDHDTVGAVYELREAAVEHGKAISDVEHGERSPEARDHLIETTLELESKTIAALDECSDAADETAATARPESAVASAASR